MVLGRVAHERDEVHLRPREVDLAAGDAGEIEEVVHEPGEVGDLPGDGVPCAASLRALRVRALEQVEAVDDGGERVPELGREDAAGEVVVAQGEAQRRDVWETRRYLSVSLKALHPLKLSEDVAVPRSRIPEMVARAKEIGARLGLVVATYGHAGDGNLHCNVLFDRPDERSRVDEAVAGILRAAVDLGGTITGEHGVGLEKRDFLEYEQGAEVVALERRLKALFDPLGILNPGKIFPER